MALLTDIQKGQKIVMEMEHNHRENKPTNMITASDPKFPIGSQATITSDHMDNMHGAKATIKGAYATTLYQITFTPKDMDEVMENHRWVVKEEIQSDNDHIETGELVTLLADHMAGMENQVARITAIWSAYMVDFTPTDGSEAYINHKWLAEDELAGV